LIRLKQYIRPYFGFIAFTMLIKLLGAVLELLIPSLMEIMLDQKVPAGDSAAIWLYGGLMLLCAGGWSGRMARWNWSWSGKASAERLR
jgi:hypothetical protein